MDTQSRLLRATVAEPARSNAGPAASQTHPSPVPAPAPRPEPAPQPAAKPRPQPKDAGNRYAFLVAAIVLPLLAWGWLTRDLREWDSGAGIGYALGIAGLSCVGLLLIYPVRKRIPVLRAIGSVPTWFHTHMLLGVAAPVLILFHCNFQLGSINSNIALWTMLIVASSGIVGRYLYAHVHRDMSGKQAALKDILDHAEVMRHNLAASFGSVEHLVDDMEQLEKRLHVRPRSLPEALSQTWSTERETARLQRKLHRNMKEVINEVPHPDRARRRAMKIQARSVSDLFEAYRVLVNEAAGLGTYERLFALWHVLHLPLFFLMVMAAAIHVVAVHLY